jgi:hypothetical protein
LAEPAEAVGGSVTTKVTLAFTELQGPAGSSVVKVKVIVPELPPIGVKTTEAGSAVAPILLN